MAAQAPPYQTPIYIENLTLGQVAEVTGNLLDTDYLKTAESGQQQWNLDPSDMYKNEYFIKLNSNLTQVVQSPEEESAQAFTTTQGDRNQNGGIQVWVLEQLQVGSNVWALRNYKTQMYLYVDYSGDQPGQTKVPIVVRQNTYPQDQHVQWKFTQV